MERVRDIVIANLIIIGLVVTLGYFTKVEVKKEYFLNGTNKIQYRLHFGA